MAVCEGVEGEVKKSKKVREVEPLMGTATIFTRVRDQLGRMTERTILGNVVSMATARAIRDWLNEALPKDKP